MPTEKLKTIEKRKICHAFPNFRTCARQIPTVLLGQLLSHPWTNRKQSASDDSLSPWSSVFLPNSFNRVEYISIIVHTIWLIYPALLHWHQKINNSHIYWEFDSVDLQGFKQCHVHTIGQNQIPIDLDLNLKTNG